MNLTPNKNSALSKEVLISIGLGLFFVFVGVELFILPRLEKFRYSATDRYIPYSDLENIEDILIKQKDFLQADIKTADLVFKVVGKEKVKRVGRLDVPNLSCQYLLQLDDIWKRASNGKFGFTPQSEVLNKSNVNRDSSKLEANFREAVGWSKKNSSSRTYPRGYFPYKIYQDDFVVPSFSEKLRECVKDRG